jgi:hypothetical protein
MTTEVLGIQQLVQSPAKVAGDQACFFVNFFFSQDALFPRHSPPRHPGCSRFPWHEYQDAEEAKVFFSDTSLLD